MSILRVLLNNFKISFLEEWEYKINFILFFILEALYLGIAIISLFVIFSYVSNIKGLTVYDLAFYVLIVDFNFMLVSSSGIYLTSYVLKGTLNNLLIRPVNEFLLMIEFNIVTLCYGILSFILIIIMCFVFPVEISFINFILMIINVIISIPLFLLPILSFRALSFWFGDVQALENSYRSIAQSFTQYPITILSKVFFVIFVSITPVGYLGWYLSLLILVGKVSYSYMLLMWLLIISLDVIMWVIFRFIYKKGLRQYEGFG